MPFYQHMKITAKNMDENKWKVYISSAFFLSYSSRDDDVTFEGRARDVIILLNVRRVDVVGEASLEIGN